MTLFVCFRCSGARYLSCSYRFHVSRWPLCPVPPEVWPQGWLCRRVGWGRLRWAGTETSFGEPLSKLSLSWETRAASLFRPHRSHLRPTWRLWFQHGRRPVGGRLPAFPGQHGRLWLADRAPEWDGTSEWPQSWSVFTLDNLGQKPLWQFTC